jgi:copper chaperone
MVLGMVAVVTVLVTVAAITWTGVVVMVPATAGAPVRCGSRYLRSGSRTTSETSRFQYKTIITEVTVAETTIAIEGMSCQHCVMAVKKALGSVPGILESDIQVGTAMVKYDESKIKKEAIESTIEKAGYKVKK